MDLFENADVTATSCIAGSCYPRMLCQGRFRKVAFSLSTRYHGNESKTTCAPRTCLKRKNVRFETKTNTCGRGHNEYSRRVTLLQKCFVLARSHNICCISKIFVKTKRINSEIHFPSRKEILLPTQMLHLLSCESRRICSLQGTSAC